MLCKCAGGGIMLCFRFRRRPLLHSSTHYFRRMNRSSVAGPRLCFGTAAQLARAGASPRPPCPQLAPAEEPQPTGPCPPAARGILATRRPTRANYRRHAGACAGGAQKLLLARQSGSIVVVSASWRVHRGRPRALPLGRGRGRGRARCPPRIARVPRLALFFRLFARRVYDSIARKQLADHRLERYAVV